MAEIEELEKKTDPLSAFARLPARDDVGLPTVINQQMVAPRVVGAQAVAVRRDEQAVFQKIAVLAAMAGDDYGYRFPVKNKKTGQTTFIEGPSIKLANDLARTYGNCDIDCRVIDQGDNWMIMARFTDLETGFSLERPFQQRKAQRSIGTDEARAQDIALQIGASKAIRNVVVNALQTFADYAHEQSKNSLVEKIGRNLDAYRAKIADRLNEHGLTLVHRAERVLGRPIGEWLAPDVAKVIALMKAAADGMTTIDEAFPSGEETSVEKPASALERFGQGSATGETEKAASGQESAGKEPSQKKPIETIETPEERQARIVAIGHEVASRGKRALTDWHNKLPADDLDAVEPHLAALNAEAKVADETAAAKKGK